MHEAMRPGYLNETGSGKETRHALSLQGIFVVGFGNETGRRLRRWLRQGDARANAALAVTWPYCALSGEPSLMMRNHAERVSDKK